jgi:hypothetical protein
MAIIGPYKAILKAKSLPWLMRMFPYPSCEFLKKELQDLTSGMTLAWPKMTYARFGYNQVWAPLTPELNPLEIVFLCSYETQTCKSSHSKITKIKSSVAEN